eukprot:3715026-Pyramimonas_sp.AAC.1
MHAYTRTTCYARLRFWLGARVAPTRGRGFWTLVLVVISRPPKKPECYHYHRGKDPLPSGEATADPALGANL